MFAIQIISIGFGLLAGIFQLLGYFYYAKKIVAGRIKPNTASWTIWAYGAILEAGTYFFLSEDWVKNILPITCTISVIALFFYCIIKGKFHKLNSWEWLVIGVDIIAAYIWWFESSVVYANFLLIFSAALSFIPIFFHVYTDPRSEDAQPWFIWALSYFFMTFAVALRWNKWEDIVYPVSFFILHLIVAAVAVDYKSRRNIVAKFSNV